MPDAPHPSARELRAHRGPLKPAAYLRALKAEMGECGLLRYLSRQHLADWESGRVSVPDWLTLLSRWMAHGSIRTCGCGR